MKNVLFSELNTFYASYMMDGNMNSIQEFNIQINCNGHSEFYV